MKQIVVFLLFSSLLCLSFSCKKTTESNALIGKWEWQKSVGGIAGQTITPTSSGKKMRLEISNNTIKKYINEDIVLTTNYKIEIKTSIFGGKKAMIISNSGLMPQSFSISGNMLYINEECYDCFGSEYLKK